MSGKTVMTVGGFTLLFLDELRPETRAVGAVSMVGSLLGQLFYAAYLTPEENGGVDSFLADAPLSRTSRPRSNALLRCLQPTFGFFLKAWLLLTLFCLYYVTFAVLFAFVYAIEPHRLAGAFCAASAVWSGWIAVVFLLAAAFSLCGRGGGTHHGRDPGGSDTPLPALQPIRDIPIDQGMKVTSVVEFRDLLARVRR